MVKPLGGNAKVIEPYYLVGLYQPEQLMDMVEQVRDCVKRSFQSVLRRLLPKAKSMYIDPMLYCIPLSIGDRSETIQDMSCALQEHDSGRG